MSSSGSRSTVRALAGPVPDAHEGAPFEDCGRGEEGRALYVLIEDVVKLFVSYPGYAGSKNGTLLLFRDHARFSAIPCSPAGA